MYPKEAINVKYAEDFNGKYTPLSKYEIYKKINKYFS
tara:strand:+ start:455 stop:565 length:111 start_codon:yes stop_codon:yes gene_type:complete